MDSIEIMVSDRYGIYVPQEFINTENNWQGITDNDREIIKNGPIGEWYWFAWEAVLDSAYYQDGENTYTLHQDGDLFAICYELITDEEKENFGFED